MFQAYDVGSDRWGLSFVGVPQILIGPQVRLGGDRQRDGVEEP